MKIIVDAYGGDKIPKEIVEGALLALEKDKDLEIVLAGKEDELNSILQGRTDRVSVLAAEEVITNHDVPTVAVRAKKNSSMVKACYELKNNPDVKGLVSAGSTGALLTGAYLIVGRIGGIQKPALATVLPHLDRKGVVLCDCGANAECRPVHLEQFAVMGSAFCSAMLGIENPKVGLLNNGAEECKGDEVHKEAYAFMSRNNTFNFCGNVEGRDILSGEADVVVADGFSGNVALKSIEGTALGVFKLIKKGMQEGGFKAKIGALLFKPVLRHIKHKLDYSEVGGACFLGVNKVVVKAHGSSDRVAICSAVLQAKNLAEAGIIEKIKSDLDKIKE